MFQPTGKRVKIMVWIMSLDIVVDGVPLLKKTLRYIGLGTMWRGLAASLAKMWVLHKSSVEDCINVGLVNRVKWTIVLVCIACSLVDCLFACLLACVSIYLACLSLHYHGRTGLPLYPHHSYLNVAIVSYLLRLISTTKYCSPHGSVPIPKVISEYTKST